MKLIKILLFFVLLFSATVQAQQLKDFTLNVNKKDETCLGNGSLTFSVGNLTPNASLIYKVYLLPDVSNPLTVLTANHLGSLSAGTYKVVAIQSLGGEMNFQEKSITIDSKIVPFNFEVATSAQNCASTGKIIVNVTSGAGAFYEVISGPLKKPLQSSNVFNDMPPGTYNVRAFNNCGVGKVKTFTLTVVSSQLAISNPSFPDNISTICDSIRVNNIITPSSGTIAYPVSVQHTLAPLSMGGDAMVINKVYSTGSPTMLEVSAMMPRYMTQSYTYEIAVTDNCGTIYNKADNTVDPNIVLTLNTGKAPCADKFLKLNVSKYTTSFSVNFISAPYGFDPAVFNATPADPFTQPGVNYGSETNPVPFGTYVVEITDICGRKDTETIEVKFEKPQPIAYAVNNGCFSEYGYIRLKMPESKLVSASIIAAPATYTETLPKNLAVNISPEGTVALDNMPLGVYTIAFTDDCGFNYEIKLEVPPYVEQPFDITMLPSCEPDFGTVRVKSGNGNLTAVSIISAPSSFGQSLPYNVSANITGGHLYMNNLPEGSYTFSATDICGVVKDMQVLVEGYNAPADSFTFTPNCGSFSVLISDNSNGTNAAGYWLQHYNEVTKTWQHPFYGQPYVEGTVPGTTTGIALTNGEIRDNINYSGKFRIVKKFETFGNGTSQTTTCISILGEFRYSEDLSITAAYTLACVGDPNNVILEITGNPTSYKIKTKNGAPFLVDNGANNIFTNLEPAEYVFEIEDACGNIDTKGFNVQNLPSIADATQPNDMIVCAEPGTMDDYEFHLIDQNAAILGDLHSAMYTITYHLTQEDADNAANALPEYYNNLTDGQTIYARLIHNEIGLCYGTTSFKLFVGEIPVPDITTQGTICNEGTITITAQAGFSSYLWSTGETTKSIQVDEPGMYTVIVEKAYGDRTCEGLNEVEIKASVTPSIVKIDTSDWTRDDNTITVYAEGSGNYEYSLDGSNYQTENVFNGLETGVYQVYVRDANGCGEDVEEVILLNYPNFFTPNGDGYHDKWRIENAVLEPHMKISIFDRYGKLITTFGSTSEGWDGTQNGIQLPSTDYWFVVTREDGRELKGHFSMLR